MKNITVNDIAQAASGSLCCGSGQTAVTHIEVDSRKVTSGALYVPIVGERTDGHLYIGSAFDKGAAACLTEKEMPHLMDDHPFVLVKDTKKALLDIGRFLRSKLDMPVVGVTGSVGKTTTREMICCALSAALKVTSTSGNSNSQIGVPITLGLLDPDADIAVMEFGMSEPGEMSRIAEVGRPQIAVITNIGVSHIENLGSQEAILAEKLHITDCFDKDGILFVNGDDPLLKGLKDRLPFNVITYGLSENCDVRGENPVTCGGAVTFDLTVNTRIPVFGKGRAKGRAGKTIVKVRLETAGRHLVQNALAALCVCGAMGLDLDSCAGALGSFKGFSRRLEIKRMKGFTLIDDSYNASPDSMKAAIDVLADFNAPGKKIAVLADMFELGKNAPLYHEEVGKYVSKKKPDAVITIGELSENIAREAIKGNVPTFITKTNEEGFKTLKTILERGDVVLLKGSNGMKLNEIASAAEELEL